MCEVQLFRSASKVVASGSRADTPQPMNISLTTLHCILPSSTPKTYLAFGQFWHIILLSQALPILVPL